MLSQLYVGLTAVMLLTSAARSEEFTGRVVGVADGDTLSVMHEGKARKVRLHGVDAPESRQAYGARAKQMTSELTFGKDVTVQVKDIDRYGRTVGVVILPDNRNFNQELLRAGMGWWYKQYAAKDTVLKQLEADARAARLGLWADQNPVPPWEFRSAKSRSSAGKLSTGMTTGTVAGNSGATTDSSFQERRSSSTAASITIAPSVSGDEETSQVYVTERGRRYHRVDCNSIAGRATTISLTLARERRIGPCGTCRP